MGKVKEIVIEALENKKQIADFVVYFIPVPQRSGMNALLKGEESAYAQDMLNKMAALVTDMPHTLQQEGLGSNAIVHLHYFNPGSDWYIIEKDVNTRQAQAFGWVVLNGDLSCAELGYINIEELVNLAPKYGIELDLHWTPCTLGAVKAKRGAR